MPTAARAPDHAGARPALAAAARRSADLLSRVGDLSLPLPGSEWTAADAAAHLVFALRIYTASAVGDLSEWEGVGSSVPAGASTPERVAAINRILIPAEPVRGPREAGEAIVEAAGAFLEATAGMDPAGMDPAARIATPWYGDGHSLSLGEATCLLLGEQVVHGYDVARAAAQRWPIARGDARLLLEAGRAMMPSLARPDALAGVEAGFRLHYGGGFVVRCSGGAVSTEDPGAGAAVDCHIAADPVALALVGYGRWSHWQAIARGRMVVWGRRPWLAFRFPGYFASP